MFTAQPVYQQLQERGLGLTSTDRLGAESRLVRVGDESCLIRVGDESCFIRLWVESCVIRVQDESCVIRAPQPQRMTPPCPVAQGEGRKPPCAKDKAQPRTPPSLRLELSSGEGGSAPAPRVQPLGCKTILFSLGLLNIEPSKLGECPLTGASRTRE